MLLFLCFLIELLLIVLLYTKQSFTLNLFSFIMMYLIHISDPTRLIVVTRIPYSA